MRTLITSLLAVAAMLAGQQANALVISVFGTNQPANIATFLNANGHTATSYGGGSVAASELAGADVAILLRGATGTADLDSFVQGGGKLVTEWTGADWATNTVNYFGSQISGGGGIGTNSPITVTADGLAMGLGNGLPNPWADGPRTEFARFITNIGTADLLAYYDGNPNNEAVIGGAVGLGFAVINVLDWADGFGSGNHNSGQFLLNMVEMGAGAAPVPAPATLALSAIGLAFAGFARRRARA